MTDPILRILDRFDARATCFLVGAQAQDDPDRVRAIAEAGHTVGSHSFTHPDPWRISNEVLCDELTRTTETLEAITGQPVRHLRPPYGRFTCGMHRWADANGQRVVMWDVMPGDYLGTATRHAVEHHVLRFARAGSIIVFHDNPIAEMTPVALETILRQLSAEGWHFEAL